MVLSVSTLKSAATQGTKLFSKPQTLKNVNLQELRYEPRVILDALKTDCNILDLYKKKGKKLSPEVISMYKKYKGPEVIFT